MMQPAPSVSPEVMPDGFVIITSVLDPDHISRALSVIEPSNGKSPERLIRSQDLYAIRDVCGVVPDLLTTIWSPLLQELVRTYCGDDAFLTKSIYFDKPVGTNWSVPFHQDISISVDRKLDMQGFSGWTQKHGIIGVVPPVFYLEQTLTMRLHFDGTDQDNGALRVIAASHRGGIRRNIEPQGEGELCCVPVGGVMLMRPLLVHASSRSISTRRRRVLHLEFNRTALPAPLEWGERRLLPK